MGRRQLSRLATAQQSGNSLIGGWTPAPMAQSGEADADGVIGVGQGGWEAVAMTQSQGKGSRRRFLQFLPPCCHTAQAPPCPHAPGRRPGRQAGSRPASQPASQPASEPSPAQPAQPPTCGVPSNSRPQPREKRVSPGNRAWASGAHSVICPRVCPGVSKHSSSAGRRQAGQGRGHGRAAAARDEMPAGKPADKQLPGPRGRPAGLID